MKKFLFFVSVITISSLIIFNSCSEKDNVSKKKPNPTFDKNVGNKPWVVIKFKWEGIMTPDPKDNPCFGGDCGKCFGFCIYFPIGIMVQEPTDDEINEGIGKAQLEILRDLDQMKISCYYNSADNGDGYTRILEDVQVLPEVAQEFGWNTLTIKAGTYVIDYSAGNPYGDFIVNIEHN